jgi:hypothetical protein
MTAIPYFKIPIKEKPPKDTVTIEKSLNID